MEPFKNRTPQHRAGKLAVTGGSIDPRTATIEYYITTTSFKITTYT